MNKNCKYKHLTRAETQAPKGCHFCGTLYFRMGEMGEGAVREGDYVRGRLHWPAFHEMVMMTTLCVQCSLERDCTVHARSNRREDKPHLRPSIFTR